MGQSSRSAGLCLFLLMAAPVAASSAGAAPAPAPKPTAPAVLVGQPHQTVTIQAVDRRFGQPGGPAATGAGAQPPAPARPTVGLDDFLADRRARLKRITDAQINKMRALISGTAEDDPQKPDFHFRLGELEAENRRYFSDRARELDERIFQAAAGDKAVLKREQEANERRAGAWRLEAVKAYLAASRFPRYERLDEVLFRLAAELTAAKKDAEAREFLLRLIKDYPRSRYVPDAYLAFAELYFDRGEVDSALRFYEKVEEFLAVVARLSLRRLQGRLVPDEPRRPQGCARDLRARHPDGRRRNRPRSRAGTARSRAADQGGAQGHRGRLRAGRRAGSRLGLLPAHRRRERVPDDGGAGRALLGARPGLRRDADLPKVDGRSAGQRRAVRVADQGAAKRAVAERQARSGRGAGALGSGRRSRGAAGSRSRGRMPYGLSRCRARAGAGMAPRGAEDARRRHLSTGRARVPGCFSRISPPIATRTR